MGRLVIIHGVCFGVGQSTLCRRLAAVVPDADVLWEDERSQPSIFTRAEFADVAARFHEHNAHRDAGIGHPPPPMLEAAYAALVHGTHQRDDIALMGWSPMDLAEDLDWARSDESAFHAHIRAVREIMEPVEPVLVHLDGDIATAVDRTARQRGRDWFPGGAAIDDESWILRRRSLIAEAAVAAARTRRSLQAAAWTPAVDVDGTELNEDQVFDEVSAALRRLGVL